MKMPSLPYRRIGSIWLPGGGEFEVWSNYAIAMDYHEGYSTICLSASPQLPQAYFPKVHGMFRDAGLLGPDQFLHWVGRQTDIEHVCTCFGILEPPEAENAQA